jgi:hypothetical protein
VIDKLLGIEKRKMARRLQVTSAARGAEEGVAPQRLRIAVDAVEHGLWRLRLDRGGEHNHRNKNVNNSQNSGHNFTSEIEVEHKEASTRLQFLADQFGSKRDAPRW